MTSDGFAEKRNFHRIFYTADALLKVENNQFHCQVLDLSLKGCLLEFDQPWSGAQDLICTLSLKLSEQQSIDMTLRPCHIDCKRVGFNCISIDIDSISYLRRLVELNLGDSTLLERDFYQLLRPASGEIE